MKSRYWAIVFAAAFVLLLALWKLPRQTGTLAAVYLDGTPVKTVELTKEQRFTVSGPAGDNVIVVHNGQIFVESADCPDKTCVRHGPLGSGGPIVCLPNRLVIRFVQEKTVYDAVSGRAG